MSVYTVHSVSDVPCAAQSLTLLPWQTAEEGHISCFPWDPAGEGYRPDSRFYLLYSRDTLYVLLLTAGKHEANPRREATDHQGAVSKDSCLEFFFSYDPEKPDYVNFETNALGTIHAGFGPGRGNRFKAPADELEGLRYYPVAKGDGGLEALGFAYDWGVIMEVPKAFLAKFWTEAAEGFRPGQQFKANFYKCGDLCPEEHYGVWAPVSAPKPDYHRPECFGLLILK